MGVPSLSLRTKSCREMANEDFNKSCEALVIGFLIIAYIGISIIWWSCEGMDSITYCQYVINGWVSCFEGISYFFSRLI
ncbi:MAG: hypothetical protein ACTSWK_17685 [Promethearchaeota archaeon]